MSNELRRSRTDALKSLVELRLPIGQAVAALTRYPWDSDEELLILTRANALRLMRGYQQGELTAAECRRWAETLEGRDDVGLENGFEDLLKEFLFQISTPELFEPLTSNLAARWETYLEGQTCTRPDVN